jgi:cell division protein FtsW (lipid II flippase)
MALLIALVVALVQTALLAWSTPPIEQVREVALSRALSAQTLELANLPPQPEFDAARYCEAWTGLTADSVDCVTGRGLVDHEVHRAPLADEADRRAKAALAAYRARLEALAQLLQAQQSEHPALQQLVMELRRRALRCCAEESTLRAPAAGPPWFDPLLQAQGLRYQASTGQVSRIGWDVARLAERPKDALRRGSLMEGLLKGLAPGWALLSASLMAMGVRRAGHLGLAVTACTTSFLALGLGLAVSASAGFGLGLLQFPLNPLGNQAVRQAVLILLGSGLVLAMGALPVMGRWTASVVIAHPLWSAVLLPMMVALAYAAAGPAAGSETLKLGVAVVSASLVVGLGRVTHAAREWAPTVLSWRYALRAEGPVGARIRHRLWYPLLAYCGAVLLTVALVAAMFHDLGAALVGSLLALATVLLVFGGFSAALLALGFVLVGTLLLGTEKLQARVNLMRDPWTAQVSDFARLEAFSSGAPGWGWGLRSLPWCNETGVCLPLQILSDYTPTLLKGALGSSLMVLVFLVLCLGSCALAAWLVRHHLTQTGACSMLAMVAFFLLMATVVQTLVTFLGNWRVIPLTGLGTPLVSIGLSSLAAPLVSLGLLLQLNVQAQGRARA